MNRILIEDLPKWSLWPARMLGLSPWTIPTRNIDKVKREYDQDKFAKCLAFCRERGDHVTPEEVRCLEMGGDATRKICVSLGNELYEQTLEESRNHYDSLLAETLAPELQGARTVVELGAGYGYNLWSLRKKFGHLRYVGGELSGNAVAVAQRLYRAEEGMTVRPFNFYDPNSYSLVSDAEPPVVLFSSYAVEQLTESVPFLDGLRSCRRTLKSVVLFESLYESEGHTLLSLLRRRYTEINDYNRDLQTELARRPEIAVTSCRKNVYGQNPLHPISILQLRFV
jgi:hypothetical protein